MMYNLHNILYNKKKKITIQQYNAFMSFIGVFYVLRLRWIPGMSITGPQRAVDRRLRIAEKFNY